MYGWMDVRVCNPNCGMDIVDIWQGCRAKSSSTLLFILYIDGVEGKS